MRTHHRIILGELQKKVHMEYILEEEKGLDFYQPIGGEGKDFWIAKISIVDKTAYYCAAETINDLLNQILEKEQKYFPRLLELDRANLEISRERLICTHVSGHLVKEACKRLEAEGRDKEIAGTKIPASVSVPADYKLMPIIEPSKEKIKGFTITERELLAKYEVLAKAARIGKIWSAHLEKRNDKIIWVLTSDKGKLFLDASTGELMEQWGMKMLTKISEIADNTISHKDLGD